MRKQLFHQWNWEFDYGVEPIDEREQLPENHAVAYFDRLGRLYRVEVCGGSSANHPAGVFRYDYFCDERGRILQKRSLDDNNEVFVIVDFDYDDQKSYVTETAWWPNDGVCKSIQRQLNSE